MAIPRSRPRRDLQEAITGWKTRLEKALINVENSKRDFNGASSKDTPSKIPQDAWVVLPTGPSANLRLLNLKVWCQRYSISPEFLVSALCNIYRHNRKGSRSYLFSKAPLSLGLPAGLISSINARSRLLEAIGIAFPQGENLKSKPVPIPPINREAFSGLEAYDRAITKARREFELSQDRKRKQDTSPRRAYRHAI